MTQRIRSSRRRLIQGAAAAGLAAVLPFRPARRPVPRSQARRHPAALGLPGTGRSILPARRRHRPAGAVGPRTPGRGRLGRLRVQRRPRPDPGREADSRRRQRADRRLRFRRHQRHRPGLRAEGGASGDQHRRRPADHRAGLQVRLPQLPDQPDAGPERPRSDEGHVQGDQRHAEERHLHPCQRHLRPGQPRRRSTGCSRPSTCRSSWSMPSPTIPAQDLSVEVAKCKASGADLVSSPPAPATPSASSARW